MSIVQRLSLLFLSIALYGLYNKAVLNWMEGLFHVFVRFCTLSLPCLYRTLDNKALSHVLSFVGKTPSSYAVCKYWKVCVDENELKKGKN